MHWLGIAREGYCHNMCYIRLHSWWMPEEWGGNISHFSILSKNLSSPTSPPSFFERKILDLQYGSHWTHNIIICRSLLNFKIFHHMPYMVWFAYIMYSVMEQRMTEDLESQERYVYMHICWYWAGPYNIATHIVSYCIY